MNKFQKQLAAIFSALGFTDKAKAGTMNEEDWKKVFSDYKEKYGTELKADLQENQRLAVLEAEQRQILDVLNVAAGTPAPAATETPAAEGAAPAPAAEDGSAAPVAAPAAEELTPIAKQIQTLFASMQQQIDKMAAVAKPDVPADSATMQITAQGPGTTETHLFGISAPMFSMEKRWNKIAQNPSFAIVNAPDEEADLKAFQTELSSFSKSTANRYAQLHREGRLNSETLKASFGITTTGLADAGLGAQFIVRRQDALIARILEIDSVDALFPVRYGIQDREMITNAFFTEVSQAYQEGEIWKGSMTLEPEFGHVDDGMAKFKFGSMKEIERLYIGYLNTSGSDPIKWGMIEFMLLNMYLNMANEYNIRRILGIYVKPESGVAGSYLNAGTGVIYTLIRYYHENKLLLNDDDAYATYDNTDFLDTVKDLVEEVRTNLAPGQKMNGQVVHLNENHQQWWINNCRTTYGKDIDFQGPNSYLNIVPDTKVAIAWVPNMDQLKFIFIQRPGNLQGLGYVPGEMYAVKLKEDMELVKGWSTWKEGTSASFTGRRFTTASDLKANKYAMQQIFCNKPATAVVADATTVDAESNFWFVTGVNTKATALTDIVHAVGGPAYIIECGDVTFPTTIAKAAKFSELTGAYTPTAVGDYIMVVLASTGKFLEMERCVGGVRTVNPSLQPNVPGAR
jgi:hypothetical protein